MVKIARKMAKRCTLISDHTSESLRKHFVWLHVPSDVGRRLAFKSVGVLYLNVNTFALAFERWNDLYNIDGVCLLAFLEERKSAHFSFQQRLVCEPNENQHTVNIFNALYVLYSSRQMMLRAIRKIHRRDYCLVFSASHTRLQFHWLAQILPPNVDTVDQMQNVYIADLSVEPPIKSN